MGYASGACCYGEASWRKFLRNKVVCMCVCVCVCVCVRVCVRARSYASPIHGQTVSVNIIFILVSSFIIYFIFL